MESVTAVVKVFDIYATRPNRLSTWEGNLKFRLDGEQIRPEATPGTLGFVESLKALKVHYY